MTNLSTTPLTPPPSAGHAIPREQPPPFEDQYNILKRSIVSPLHPDQIWYILPASWFLLLRHLAFPSKFPAPRQLATEAMTTLEAPKLRVLIEESLYTSAGEEGKYTGTEVAKGYEGDWQLKPGLVEMEVDEEDDVEMSTAAGSSGLKDNEDDNMEGEGISGGDEKMVASMISEGGSQPDIVLIEKTGWDKIQSWYGPSDIPSGLPRKVVSSREGILQIELAPSTFILFQTTPPSDSTNAVNSQQPPVNVKLPIRITLGRDALLSDLHQEIRKVLGYADSSTPSRIWQLGKNPRELSDAQIQQAQNNSLRLDIPSHLLAALDSTLISTFPQGPTENDDLLQDIGLFSGDSLALELPIDTSDDQPRWAVQVSAEKKAMGASTTAATAGDVNMEDSPSTSLAAPKPLFGAPLLFSGTNSAASTSVAGLQTRSKTETTNDGKGKTPGLRGLTNLGNTCFMNSGLQCLSNTPELSQYFQSGAYVEELNPDNPLGMGGDVATKFGNLIEQIWDPNGSSNSSSIGGYGSYNNAVTPRAFKSMIGRYAPSFAGYGQQDTQELIAFLLDGLHEDLNRIKKKPYIEKPDWVDGGKEKELALFAKECWDGYKKRNDSAIVDLFQGQLKSTLVCPDCHRESITLDPFMYLTLPIPVKRYTQTDVYVVPADPARQKIKVTAQYKDNTTFAQFKRTISNLVDLPAQNLIAIDRFNHNVYSFWDDDALVSSARKDDVIVFYEVGIPIKQGSNGAAPAKKDESLIVVPVYSLTSNENAFLEPMFITLTRSQAADPEAIRRIIGQYYAELVETEKEADFVELLAEESATGSSSEPSEGEQLKETPIGQNLADGSNDEQSSQTTSTTGHKSPFELTLAAANTSQERDFTGRGGSFFKGKSNKRRTVAEALAGKNSFIHRTSTALRDLTKSYTNDEDKDTYPLVEWKDAIFTVWDKDAVNEFFGNDLQGRYRDPKMFVQRVDPAIFEQLKRSRDPKLVTLNDCLDDFERQETLGENDLWYCSECKKHQAATKKMEIYQVPDILVICLKRFSQGGWSRRKIDEKVDFPIEGLDLEDRVDERRIARTLTAQGVDVAELGIRDVDETLMFDLYAVDNHYGGMGGGHYTATCKNAINNKWYKFDDSHVSEASVGDIKSSAAYLLFYRRRTARPIGGVTKEKTEAGLRSRGSSTLSLPGLVANSGQTSHEPSKLSESMTLPPQAETIDSDDSDRVMVDTSPTTPGSNEDWSNVEPSGSDSSAFDTADEQEVDPPIYSPPKNHTGESTIQHIDWSSLGRESAPEAQSGVSRGDDDGSTPATKSDEDGFVPIPNRTLLESLASSPPPLLVSSIPSRSSIPLDSPHITLTYAQSSDGKIAGPGRKQIMLSGKESMLMTHWMRSMHDAIMVGVGTAVNDDPRLNLRLLPSNRHHLAPIPLVLDPNLRLRPNARMLTTLRDPDENIRSTAKPPILLCRSDLDPQGLERKRQLEEAGAKVVPVSMPGGRLDLALLPEVLVKLGLKSMMVEGGAEVIQSFLDAKKQWPTTKPETEILSDVSKPLVDRVIVTVAPLQVPDGLGLHAEAQEMIEGRSDKWEVVNSEQFGKDKVVVLKPSMTALGLGHE